VSKSRVLITSTFFALSAVLSSGAIAHTTAGLPKAAKVTVNQPVTLTDKGDNTATPGPVDPALATTASR
jgi:hypothetical protein